MVLAATALSAEAAPPTDIVLYASTAPVRVGAWNIESDPTAAGAAALRNPDLGAAKLTTPLKDPTSYFEVTFDVVAGQPYHLWIRGKAQNNSWANDSVYVQFADPDGLPTATYGRGTTSAATVSIEDCSGCGVAGWGWQDQAYGALAPNIVFARSGTHTMRVQQREDGITIDQIVLSSSTYLSSAPGALKNDNTILTASSGGGGTPPPATFVRQPFLQQTTSTSVKVVWATRELQSAAVQVWTGTASPVTYPATASSFPASATGMTSDYYQYEAAIDRLEPSTTYTYKLQMNGTDLTAGADHFDTAPLPGTGTTRFIAFGDSGVGSAAQYSLASLMATERFDFVMHLGDIAYGNANGTGPASYTAYQSRFFDVYRDILRARAVFPTIGNHDDATASAQAYRDVFVLPEQGASTAYPQHAERFYSFDYGIAHFVSLDTETAFLDLAQRQVQVDWLKADLAATTQAWKVVFFHRPPYSTGSGHGSDLTIRGAFGPIFEQYNVQLVINGHDHDYERTVPIKTSADPSTPPVTYIVSGGGGGPLYTVSGGSFTAFARSAYHYLRAEASECQLTVQPIGLDGVAFDSLTLERCGTTTPPGEIVVYAKDVPAGNIVGADWSLAADSTAAVGFTLKDVDRGSAKVTTPAARPASYVDVPFSAEAGVPYSFWFRMKAQNNATASDSVYVQFSGATNASRQPIYPIGSTTAASVILENGSGAGLAGWGWTDSSYGSLAAPIYFAAAGPQSLRIQTREDGVSIDQIVISAGRYLTTAPGATKNDNTIVPKP
jgi:calcineurin-like phosphoesterase family protein/purple acid phosphatase-like protein